MSAPKRCAVYASVAAAGRSSRASLLMDTDGQWSCARVPDGHAEDHSFLSSRSNGALLQGPASLAFSGPSPARFPALGGLGGDSLG